MTSMVVMIGGSLLSMTLIHVGKLQKQNTCTYTIIALQFFKIIEKFLFFSGKGSKHTTVKSRQNTMLTSETLIANFDFSFNKSSKLAMKNFFKKFPRFY